MKTTAEMMANGGTLAGLYNACVETHGDPVKGEVVFWFMDGSYAVWCGGAGKVTEVGGGKAVG